MAHSASLQGEARKKMELKLAVLVLSCFLLLSTKVYSSDREERLIAEAGNATAPPLPAPHKIVENKDCLGACDARCTLQSRKNRCSRACLSCCVRCRCVPAGTFGNQVTCGKCYTEWTTHGNRTKCP